MQSIYLAATSSDARPKDIGQLLHFPNEFRETGLVLLAAHLPEESPRGAYREFAPPRHLREHIICIWHRAGGAATNGAQILPDGCIDVIWTDDAPPIVAGPMTAPQVSGINAGAEIIGVRFRPGAAPALLGVSARELQNLHLPLGDIWPRDRLPLWSAAADRVHVPAKLEAIVGAISHRLGSVDPPDAFIIDAARWIAEHPSGSLDDLARLSGLSERQVRRRFDEAIGYGPKKLQRILRMQRLLWLAGQQQARRLDLADLALIAGYADQPHMTREVTALGGTPPSIFLRGTVSSAVSDLFKTSTP